MADRALDLAEYRPDRVIAGPSTGWTAKDLELDLDAIERACSDGPFDGVRVDITQPFESIRIVNVLDVVAPMTKVHGGGFPGITREPGGTGGGRTNTIANVGVISAAALSAEPDAVPAVIDLAGPASYATPWSETFNVVLSFSPREGADDVELDRAIRSGTLRVADLIAATTTTRKPDAVSSFTVGSGVGSLPKVCLILAIASEGTWTDTLVNGVPFRGPDPRLMDPLEILDGAIVSGAYTPAGTRQTTYDYQRSALVRRLLADHGERLDFTAVVLTLAYLDDADAKERMARSAASLAASTGAVGAILTTYGGGNSHTDVMLTAREAERRGVRSTVILAETNGGLTDHLPEADSIVSVGNEDELLPEWRPERVIGGTHLPNGRLASDSGPLPFLAYVGSVTQTGDRSLGIGTR